MISRTISEISEAFSAIDFGGLASADNRYEESVPCPIGFVGDGDLILKYYEMLRAGLRREHEYHDGMGGEIDIISRGLLEVELIPKNLGFVIGSSKNDDSNVRVASLGIWDPSNPETLNLSFFEFFKGNVNSARRLDGEEAHLPLDQLGILSHEGSSWKRYLCSERKTADKKRYVLDLMNAKPVRG